MKLDLPTFGNPVINKVRSNGLIEGNLPKCFLTSSKNYKLKTIMSDGKSQLNLPASKLPVIKQKPGEDFRKSLHWRVFRILAEFVEGWQFLADFKKTVSFFGSARTSEGDKWYEEAQKMK